MESYILIAEDDPAQVKLIENGLKDFKTDYSLLFAKNGQEAYEMALSYKPVLILMNWTMPVMSGIESTELIRSHRVSQHIPILFITGRAIEENIKEVFSVGANDYIEKPIQRSTLILRVSALLNLSNFQKKQQEYIEEIKSQNEELKVLAESLKLANDEIKKSEQKYRLLADNFPNGIIYTVDKELKTTFVAGQELKNAGVPEELCLNKTPYDAIETFGTPPELAAKVAYHYEKTFEGTSQYFESHLYDSYYANWTTPVVNEQGIVEQILAVSQNITEGKKARKKLEEQERFLDKLFHTIPSLLYVFDPQEEQVTWVNEKVFEFAGYRSEEVKKMGIEIWTLVHPDELAEVREQLKVLQTAKSGDVVTMEYRLKHRNGYYLWVKGFFSVLEKDRDGKVRKVLSYLQNINRHKLSEIKLLENETFLKKMMELSPNNIYIIDAISKESIYANQTAWSLLGYTQEEAQKYGQDFIPMITHPDDMPTVQKHLGTHLRMKEGDVVELTHRVKDAKGSWHWLLSKEVVFKRQTDGTPAQILGTAQDITAIKEIEIELQKNKDFIETITKLSPNFIYVFNIKERKYSYFNRHPLLHLGYSTEDIDAIGKDFLAKVIHPEDLPKTLKYIESFKDRKDNECVEYAQRMKDPNGEWRWLLSSEFIFTRDSNGEPIEIIGSAQDITEVKAYEQKLVKINESKDRVLATVAHDLRNPIQSIKGMVYIFRKQFEGLDEDDYEMLDMVDSSCQKAINLIEELLEISELENDGYNLHLMPCEINHFIRQTLRPFEEKLSAKKLTLFYEFIEEEVHAQINDRKFFRVFENLITNAIKFTPEGGVITIKTAVNQENVRIEISDNGIGIPHELQPIIFDKFSKAGRRGLGGEKSTGLGMSIVKQIVELHHGEIWLESEEGTGSTFFIELPLSHTYIT